jgi:DNA helicase HerA-like ATPase
MNEPFVPDPPPTGGPDPLGRVAAPPEHESTSGAFYFWVHRDKGVERTQIVRTESRVGGQRVRFVGIVEEVYRRSRQRDVGEESARYDGRTAERPPFDSEGVTYAKVAVLRTEPVAHTPPTEESPVFLADEAEAGKGYGTDRMGRRLDVGLLRNGGTGFAGKAPIDLDFLLGKNGGHLNVNGIAGLASKTSLLLHVNWLLLREARRQMEVLPSGSRLQLIPVMFNVKNYDLFFIDRWSADFRKNDASYREEWLRFGVGDPAPFGNVKFFAPQTKEGVPVNVGRADAAVQAYSWSLADVIRHRLFKFLFSEEDVYDANFGGLVGELEEWLTTEANDGPRLRSTDGAPQTFQELPGWFKKNKDAFADSHPGTRGKLIRRLKYIVHEGDGVLRRNDPAGHPLVMPRTATDERGDLRGPLVIDLFGLRLTPSLQRFVVAAVFHQLVQFRSGNTVEGLRYLITLDELNRFAPKGGGDPITQQVETVASEMRSQGVILLGAQQQASLVSPRVIENAAVRAVGRSGTLELNNEVWRFLGPTWRAAAAQLQPDEKLLIQPSFREPMLAKVPFPPFALNKEDAEPAGTAGTDGAPPRRNRLDADFA